MITFQCSVASRQRRDDLFATASAVRRWLLIEVRGAWGHDAIGESALGPLLPDGWRQRRKAAGVRVLTVRRDPGSEDDGIVRLFHADAGARRRPGRLWSLRVPSLDAAVAAAEELPDHDGDRGWTPESEPLVLVCTNGRHDACCATFGRPLVRALRSSARRERVWECSHVGGDRFAANLVLLPDGHYFGHCDVHVAAAVLDAHEHGRLVLDHYRGRSAYGFGEQAAEHVVRRRLGLTGVDDIVAVEAADGSPDTYRVVVDDRGRRHTATVTVRRTMEPARSALTCAGPPGASAPVYELVDLRLDD